MDVTPQLIEQIEFSEKFRGYDPDQVDDFLERVGATLAELIVEVRELTDRADRAERETEQLRSRPAPEPAPVPSGAMTDEEEVEQAARTLLLAKRTSDAAISEARAEADRLVREAEAQREELLRRAREDAENEFVSQRGRFTEEIRSLEIERGVLAEQVHTMETRITAYRNDIDTATEQIRRVLGDPSVLAVREPLGFEASSRPSASPFFPTGSVPLVDVRTTSAQTAGEYVPASDVDIIDAPAPQAPAPAADGLFAGAGPEPSEAESTQVYSDLSNTQQHDRYMSKLDAAVNPESESEVGAEGDEAMTAFFEGDEPSAGRRFGRRR